MGEFDHIVAAMTESPVTRAFTEMSLTGDFSALERNQAKRHHFLPQLLLRRFAFEREGKTGIFQMKAAGRAAPRRVGLRGAASRNRLYSIPDEDGKPSNRNEGYLALIEGHAAPALGRLLSDPGSLSPGDAWWTPNTETGRVANATWERWGVPLRYVDEQELEYREWLYSTNAAKIDTWVEATEPANFAGYYLDNKAGGIMYVGFLGNQEEQLNQLKASLNLVAQGRVRVYPVPPTISYLSARATAQAVVNVIETSSSLAGFVTSVRLEKSGTLVHVGATNVAQVESSLLQAVPGAHLVVQFEPRTGQLLSGRYRTAGRMRGGDAVFAHVVSGVNTKCSAGFGTKTPDGQRGGQQHWKVFVLTAGHCVFNGIGTGLYRSTDADQENEAHWSEIGTVQHDRYPTGYITMDAAAIEAHTPKLVPQGQWGANGNLVPTQRADTVQVNQTVCFSGIVTQLTCGPVTEITPYWAGVEEHSSPAARAGYWVKFDETPAAHGDSGAPVWSIFGDSIGLISAMGGPNEKHGADETFVEPLLTPPGLNRFTATGVLTDPAFAPMSLKLAADGE